MRRAAWAMAGAVAAVLCLVTWPAVEVAAWHRRRRLAREAGLPLGARRWWE